ncbi:hypothetical protein CQW23_14427 [Capsicum baccatum]|uniref:PORR domain-containing protein n=1 Tax=Capsicum baccatum TaxID=33114 RepID=A0A2G2WJC0_CAPBA|nr:hypothetical protein CQW23_14427 [Capsicum baccatum]
MKSEFIALDKVGEEVEWLQNFLEDIPYWPKPVALVCIRCDSQAAIGRAGSMMCNGKSHHIRWRHNTIRELLFSGIITIDYVKSKDNVSDPLTKGLSREAVERTSKGMGLRPRTSQHGEGYGHIAMVLRSDRDAENTESRPSECVNGVFDQEEEDVKDMPEGLCADRLAKLLMMCRDNRLNVVKRNELRRNFGFPDNFLLRIVPKYSEIFRVVNHTVRQSSMEIELTDWNPDLAIFAIERMAKKNGREPCFPCSLPQTWVKSLERNDEGVTLLYFTWAFGLVVVNSNFSKKEVHLVTFRSSVAKTQIDILLLRKGDWGICKDCKVLPSESLSIQHRFLVMDLEIIMEQKSRGDKLMAGKTWGSGWDADSM